MKGFATTWACVFGVLGTLLTAFLIMEFPHNFLIGLLWRGVNAVLPAEVVFPFRADPTIRRALAIHIASALVGGVIVFVGAFVAFMKLELWSAGLASKKSADALKKKKGLTVAEEGELLVAKYGKD